MSKKVSTKKTVEVIAEVEEVMSAVPEKEETKMPVVLEEESEEEEVSNDVFAISSNEFSVGILKTLETLQKSKGASALKTASIELEKQFRSVCEKHFPIPTPVKTSTKKRTTGGKKDPSVPKKPLAAYIIFCGEHRTIIKNENPDMKFIDITRALGSKWNSLSEEEKEVFNQKHALDVERYQNEMKEANIPIEPKKKVEKKKVEKKKVEQEESDEQEDSDEPKKVEPKKKAEKKKAEPKEKKPKEVKQKELTEPKRGVSAYISFCKEMRPVVKAEIPTIASNEILAELGRRWHLLSDEEKKPYKDMATIKKVEQKEKKVEEPKEEIVSESEEELEDE
jgi:hypothetical protein